MDCFLKHPYKRFFPFYILYFYQSRFLSHFFLFLSISLSITLFLSLLLFHTHSPFLSPSPIYSHQFSNVSVLSRYNPRLRYHDLCRHRRCRRGISRTSELLRQLHRDPSPPYLPLQPDHHIAESDQSDVVLSTISNVTVEMKK